MEPPPACSFTFYKVLFSRFKEATSFVRGAQNDQSQFHIRQSLIPTDNLFTSFLRESNHPLSPPKPRLKAESTSQQTYLVEFVQGPQIRNVCNFGALISRLSITILSTCTLPARYRLQNAQVCKRTVEPVPEAHKNSDLFSTSSS
jgi:hypothetical protein